MKFPIGSMALVCHDAGAANLAIAWLSAIPSLDCHAVLTGPALSLAKEAGLSARYYSTLSEAFMNASWLLTGTGWASVLEHDARKLAQLKNIRSIAVLDHWVNYQNRFERNHEIVLPDEIWVADDEALRIASACFPFTQIIQQPNIYLQTTINRITPPPTVENVLYLLEPTRNNWGRQDLGEFQALDYFMDHRAKVGISRETPIRLRPHPSDQPGKYDNWLKKHRETATLDRSHSLAESISLATWVAGCETAALVIGMAAARRALCTLPPWAPACRLPHIGLIHLKLIADG